MPLKSLLAARFHISRGAGKSCCSGFLAVFCRVAPQKGRLKAGCSQDWLPHNVCKAAQQKVNNYVNFCKQVLVLLGHKISTESMTSK
jgi:hypothetical protein